MRFEIAGLGVEVDGLGSLTPELSNLEPFVAKAGGKADGVGTVCTIECGRLLDGIDGQPLLENTFDGKTLRLWLLDGGYAVSLQFGDGGRAYRLRASGDWSRVKTDCNCGTRLDCMALADFIMISFIYSAAHYGTVLVHASCVAVDSSAAMFIGPSGVGKSTHSRLWLQYVEGARLLNDDQPALRLCPDGHVYVYGTPWSGKTSCYRNERARLEAVFRMNQALTNKAVRLDRTEAFCALLDMTSLMKCDASSFSKISETVAGIAGKVDTYVLYNRPDREAVQTSHALFSRHG